jgi:hypothetical protein
MDVWIKVPRTVQLAVDIRKQLMTAGIKNTEKNDELSDLHAPGCLYILRQYREKQICHLYMGYRLVP